MAAMTKSEEQVRKAAEKAMEVFETVELMEQVLLKADARDILHAMQAVKCMRDTVNGSSKIQKKIGLLPDKKSDFRLPLWPECERFKSLTILDRMPEEDQDQYILTKEDPRRLLHGFRLEDYDGQLDGAYDSRYDDMMEGQPPPDLCKVADFLLICEPEQQCLTKMGSRIRAMSPCQPPVPELTTHFYCGHCGDDGSVCLDLHHGANVSPRDGEYVTLGDVQRTLVKVRQDHRVKCAKPKAKSTLTVEFQARMKLKRDSPIRAGRHEETLEWERYYNKKSREIYSYSDSEDEGEDV